MRFDCIIIGGGIAGLQAAIQLGRYAMHSVLVIDSSDGRSSICLSYRNLLGYPEGVSGMDLRRIGMNQASSYGVQFTQDKVINAQSMQDGSFLIHGDKDNSTYEAATLLLATGVMDRFPELPGLRECLGLTVFVCPDCDGFKVKDRATLVLGSGDTGANMALTLRAWTSYLLYINHEHTVKSVSSELLDALENAGIGYLKAHIQHILAARGSIQSVVMQDGLRIDAERAFLAFGGNEVRSTLADQLGAHLHENMHILTHPRSKMTSIPNLWAAGDVAVHSEQVTIAMGEGSQAAIWIHKALLERRNG
ncbi:pyridine nucleotide-disulfide oxidoreductase [Paenibacillus baekrokdamisoli]|uniref:Pyridine nucleotide-disulfide oxidoreductase n=1 Tax=Paenibacillus baekrokdamisoli TaxID=1712516 RepID=A0A3G9IZ78_9BACL|nr:NAD(P)/FAD-dependent oxidoreductase [Paenibacillus baekrokdamisoli]BBH23582.1 pyridine nucleotide-disulfide oxidoreductase [Paenibacillus baekrokdamisoli]